MSVEAIAWAFKQDVEKSSHKFVLVAACDWASNGELFASIPSLAKKTGMNEKTVRAALHWLSENGFIEPTGERRGHTKQVIVYRLNPTKNGRVKDSQKREATKNGSLPKTDANPTKNGRVKDSQKREADTQALNSRDTQDPTLASGSTLPAEEPEEPDSRRRGIRLKTWLDSLPNGEQPIRADDPIFNYAETTGIPHEFLALAWEQFCSGMIHGAKRQRDWRAHFRNAVRGNWFRLWWFDDADGGAAKLTTAGKQAMRLAQATETA